MKMFLTRLGENSKMIINGDLSQVDLPSGTKSGLREAMNILQNNLPQISHSKGSTTISQHIRQSKLSKFKFTKIDQPISKWNYSMNDTELEAMILQILPP